MTTHCDSAGVADDEGTWTSAELNVIDLATDLIVALGELAEAWTAEDGNPGRANVLRWQTIVVGATKKTVVERGRARAEQDRLGD